MVDPVTITAVTEALKKPEEVGKGIEHAGKGVEHAANGAATVVTATGSAVSTGATGVGTGVAIAAGGIGEGVEKSKEGDAKVVAAHGDAQAKVIIAAATGDTERTKALVELVTAMKDLPPDLQSKILEHHQHATPVPEVQGSQQGPSTAEKMTMILAPGAYAGFKMGQMLMQPHTPTTYVVGATNHGSVAQAPAQHVTLG